MRLLSFPTVLRRARDAARVPGPVGRHASGRGLGLLTLAGASLLAGCGGYGQPDEDFEDTLVVKGACGDVYFFAHDEEGEILLEVTLPPILDEVAANELTYTWILPLPDVEIAVSTGEQVSALACNDVVVDGGPRVEHRWVATEGSILLHVTPGEPVRGTLELEGVHLEGELQPLELESFTISNQPLGQLPG